MIKKYFLIIRCGVIHASEKRLRQCKQSVKSQKITQSQVAIYKLHQPMPLNFGLQLVGMDLRNQITVLQDQIQQEYQATQMAQQQLEEFNKNWQAEDDRLDILKSRLAYFQLLTKAIIGMYNNEFTKCGESHHDVLRADFATLHNKGRLLTQKIKIFFVKDFSKLIVYGGML